MGRAKRTQRESSGFTLIELLVVIAIIAVLAAILFPVFTKAKHTAHRTRCMSQMKQVVTATLIYTDNWNGVTPGPYDILVSWGDGRGWTERVARYLQGKTATAPTKKDAKVYNCPQQEFNYSYGIIWAHDGPATNGFSISQVKRPSKMIFIYHLRPMYKPDLADEGTKRSMNYDSSLSNDGQRDGQVYYKHPVKGTSNGMSPYYLAWPGVHEGGNNLAFVDGHVGFFGDWNPDRMTFYRDPAVPH